MRIGIPTAAKTGEAGAEAPIYGHFGSAPSFVIVDTDKGTFEIVENSGREHEHGQCNPFQSLESHSVDALVTGGIGQRAVQLLRQRNIKVYRATVERNAAEAVLNLQSGKLSEISLDEACAHHEGHHDS
jgi:predicted Fe-Mo cluster-binding NifX family protein